MIFEFDCIVCGKHVRKRRSPANVRTPPKYCSHACHGKDRAGKTLEIRAPRITMICECCGKTVKIYRSPSQLEKATPRFCSLKCLGESQRGKCNPSFNGGRHMLKNGYIVVLAPDHPSADPRGYVYEHRLVAEETIGRFLIDNEVIHHIDGDKTNNDPSNLHVFPNQSEHMHHHMMGNDYASKKKC